MPSGWRAIPALARVFPVIGEFPLPDGSMATVRARRVPPVDAAPAAVAAAVEAALRRRLGDVVRDVEGLQIHVVYDDAIRAGRIGRVEIRTLAATFGEFARGRTPTLRVRDIQAWSIEDFLVNPWSAREGRLDPLDAGRVRFESATLALADLQAYLAALPRLRRLGGGRRRRCVAGHRAAGRTRRQRARAVAERAPTGRSRWRPSTCGWVGCRCPTCW